MRVGEIGTGVHENGRQCFKWNIRWRRERFEWKKELEE